ncbi:uncharacterized protein HMPREF1541_07924 [Cyphellophora europaea CBS 101466]|uniref:AB hydrolase-1 domain-containing protein n=1 Tax=Cyphellophora europaea (strain CBS 101466) TaxID=1220924 RepID=W2RKD5_CYPE1|nr:uncharacterized protein HMPREF1541_07924 [Cyphellophora europaea CBS 101466]ETN36937.1 hypothetical protein HMPREF1541_07924 [Cyphellophora europaea CBS 101466]
MPPKSSLQGMVAAYSLLFRALVPSMVLASPLNFSIRQLEWKNCSTDSAPSLQCAEVQVPLDWNNPSGRQINLFINKQPAVNAEKRIGSLFFHPGGPGASAAERVAKMDMPDYPHHSQQLREVFDLIGADQRGCGQSSPVKCDVDLLNVAMRHDQLPASRDEWEAGVEAFDAFGQSCLEQTGEELLSNMDTISAAKDMEAIRTAIGEKLTYWGSSYGTQLGYTYAELFPDNIRAMVLDGVIDHSYTLAQVGHHATARAVLVLEHFFEWAGNDSASPLRGEDVLHIYNHLRGQAQKEPLAAPGCKDSGFCATGVTDWEFRSNLVLALKYPENYPAAAQWLAEAMDGNATGLATPFVSKATEWLLAHAAIACIEWSLEEGTWEVHSNRRNSRDSLSPYGWLTTPETQWAQWCRRWPIPVRNPPKPIKVPTLTAPVLLVHALWDTATSYDQAVSVQQKIPGSRLLTRRGDGHGSFANHGQTKIWMEKFMVDLELPEVGTVLDD